MIGPFACACQMLRPPLAQNVVGIDPFPFSRKFRHQARSYGLLSNHAFHEA
jgi:hypothetical protein